MKLKNFILFSVLFLAMSTFGQKVQEPKDLSSYISEEITFTSKYDNLKLAGTLTYPKVGKKFPVAILISGSGPQDRNSELLGHKPFLVISDYLTKNGIAVLRVDDRGTGASQGIYNKSRLEELVNDTKATIEFIKTHHKIDTQKIGLIGHSLGAVIAPKIASENKDIAFIVLLAGSGIPGDQLMLLQKEIIERKMGVNEFGIAMGRKNISGAYKIITESDSDFLKLESALAKYFIDTFGEALPAEQVAALTQQLTLPWLVDFIKYDPAPALSRVTCPTLALIGSNDVQVPAKENLAALRMSLEKSGNKDVTLMELPKLNHLFQESETGLPKEYATIKETFSPSVLELMTSWIQKRTN